MRILHRICLGVLLLALVAAAPGAAQKKKPSKQSKDKGAPLLPLPDQDTIENGLSEMLAAWQIGDVEMLHKYYADDVTVVSGNYEPPLQGWAVYVQSYQAQRARVQNVRLDRFNTVIRVKGTLAWAAYQWEFSAAMEDKPLGARGHTSLMLEKRGDRWLIVHNHTSIVEQAQIKESTPPPAAPKPAP